MPYILVYVTIPIQLPQKIGTRGPSPVFLSLFLFFCVFLIVCSFPLFPGCAITRQQYSANRVASYFPAFGFAAFDRGVDESSWEPREGIVRFFSRPTSTHVHATQTHAHSLSHDHTTTQRRAQARQADGALSGQAPFLSGQPRL